MISENGTHDGSPSVLLVDDRPANLLSLEAVLDSSDVKLVRAQSVGFGNVCTTEVHVEAVWRLIRAEAV